jgi:hypothetical protein
MAGAGEILAKADLAAAMTPVDRWGAVQEIDGKPCRVATAGQSLNIEIPAWWGPERRPPEGKVYVAEIAYKDSFTGDFWFRAHAGFGTLDCRVLPGANDGQWKTVICPFGWDQIIRGGKDGSRAVFSLRIGGGEMPIASVVVRESTPQDRESYERDLRAWIEKAGKAPNAAPFKPPETAVIPDAWKAKPFVPYARPYWRDPQWNSAPQDGEAGAAIKIRMARNEYEPATLGVYAQKDLPGVTIELSKLKGGDGELAAEVQVKTVETVCIAARKAKVRASVRLWDQYPADIPQGQSGWFWITVKTLGEPSKPGTYRGTVTVKAGDASESVPIEVTVLPITLQTIEETGITLGGCTPGFITRRELQAMKEHNCLLLNLWAADITPEFKIKDGKLEPMDFATFDEHFQAAKKIGMKRAVYWLGGDSSNFPRTLTLERMFGTELWGSQAKFMEKQSAEANRTHVLPEIKPLVASFIQQIADHAKASDYPELVMTPFDEPARVSGGRKEHYLEVIDLIHAGGLKTYSSIHHRGCDVFIPVTDFFCTNAVDEDPLYGDKVRQAGKTFWQYSGCGEHGSSADRGRYQYGWWFASYDSRGGYVWAYHWGTNWLLQSGWSYCTVTPYQVVPHVFYEGLREALDDRRYLETLKAVAQAKGTDISAFLEDFLDHCRTARDKAPDGKEPADAFWAGTPAADRPEFLRTKVVEKIIELQGR